MRTRHALPVIVLILSRAVVCCPQASEPTDREKTQPPQSADEWQRPAGIDESIAVQRGNVGGNTKQQYFLMRHRKPAQLVDKYGLVVIVPGGPGTADFLPFGANILTRHAIPEDFLVAQLVAPQWRPGDDRIVWPSHVFPDDKAEFTTEAFVAAVIDEVGTKERIDPRFVFTLGWSSSGHVLYSASTRVPKVRGSVVAMSRFLPARSVETDKVKGKAYFLYHSPEDRVCRFTEAELAVTTLTQHGAEAKLVPHKGGHGWQPFTSYADRIKEGVLWLKDVNAAAERPK